MGGEVEDRCVIFERMLCSVAVVEIPVHDEDPVEVEDFLGIPSADGYVVKETETFCLTPLCMMPRGSYQSKSVL